jgi:peptidoglycan/LPS O-acetylase OafA/YrhL
LGDSAHWGEQVRRVVAFRLDSIGYGFLLYIATEKVWPRFVSKVPPAAFFGTLLVVAIAAMSAAISASAGGIVGQSVFPYVAALLGATSIMAAVKLEGFFERRRWLSGVGLFAGKISYSVYLFHLIFVLLLRNSFGNAQLAFQVVVYVVLVTAFAATFYHVFERPILAARPRFRSGTGKPAVLTVPEPALGA